MSLHQFEQDVQPFRGRQLGIVLTVGLLGFFKTPENLGHAFHGRTLTRTPWPPGQ